MNTIIQCIIPIIVILASAPVVSFSNDVVPGFPYGVKVVLLEAATANSEYTSILNQGLVCFKQKQYTQAKDFFRKAIELCPDNSMAYINLSALYLEDGEVLDAQNLLKDAVRLVAYYDPGKKIVLYNLGLVCFRNGDYKNSGEYFSASLKLDPLFVPAQKGLQKISKVTEDVSGKVEFLQDVLIPEGSIDAVMEEASDAFKRNEVSEAIRLLKEIITVNPGYAPAYYRLGVIYVSEKDYAVAISSFNKAIELDPSLINAYTNLGGAYGQLKQYDKALSALLKAEWLDKENPKIKYNIGLVYLSVGQGDKANNYFLKAKELCFAQNNMQLISEIDKLLVN